MSFKHYLLIILITFLFGSAYPLQKIIFNNSVPPILMGSLRMLIVFIFLIPFWKFKIPPKKYWLSLLGFSIFMGVGTNFFMNLSIYNANIVSPTIIGSQLAIPFGILLSSIFLKENVSIKKWFFIFTSFFGIILITFDPELKNEKIALLLISFMAFFYGGSQVFSRYLKDLDVTLTNSFMGLVGFIVLILISIFFEGNLFNNIININSNSWFLIIYSSILVSIAAHMSLFYLYKLYPVKKVFPFYALFPIFGILQTMAIFNETPTLIMIIGSVIVISSIYILNKLD